MPKQSLTETDIRTRFITPALVRDGKWHLMTQIREEAYFTKGRVIVRGRIVAEFNTPADRQAIGQAMVAHA